VRSSWVVKSLAANGVAWLADASTLWVLHQVFGVWTEVATFIGLSVGLSASFLLNRRFAFRDSAMSLGGSLLRYAVAMAALMTLHSVVVGQLVDRFGLPLMAGKIAADVTIMLGGQLLVLRYLVFPRNKGGSRSASGQGSAELI
jgi:putative flippase GtrA